MQVAVGPFERSLYQLMELSQVEVALKLKLAAHAMMDIDNMDIGLDNNVVGFEDGGKRRPNTASAIGNKMFQRGLDGFILKFASSLISKVSRISMECQNE